MSASRLRLVSLIAAGMLSALAGCTNSLDSPVRQLTRSGQDSRTYNPQTGRYEWPDGPRRREVRSTPRSAQRETPPLPDDGRTSDPQTGVFESR